MKELNLRFIRSDLNDSTRASFQERLSPEKFSKHEDMAQAKHTKVNRRRILATCCTSISHCTLCLSTTDCNICDACDSTAGYYLTTTARPSCKSCSSAYGSLCTTCNASQCLTCSGLWEVDPANTRQCKCSSRGFMSGGSCVPCLPYCNSCTDATNCSACLLYFTLTNSGTECQPCIAGCNQCASATDCTQCQAGYGQIIISPGPNVTCTKCLSNQISEIGSFCRDCHASCATCTATTTFCTSCIAGRIFNQADGLCMRDCPDGAYYSQTSDTCAACHASCETCLNTADDCGRCKAYTSLYKLPRGFGGCSSWMPAARNESTLAVWTGVDGKTVSDNVNGIFNAASRYTGRLMGKLIDDYGYDITGKSVVTPGRSCSKLKVQYGDSAFVYNCKACGNKYGWLDDRGCFSEGIAPGIYDGTTTGDGKFKGPSIHSLNCMFDWKDNRVNKMCTTCMTNYNMMSDDLCKPTCKTSAAWNTYTLACVDDAPGCSLKASNGSCIECAQNLRYIPNSGPLTCSPCHANCSTCESNNTCLTCAPGYQSVSTSPLICLHKCEAGFYYDANTSTCIEADINCKTAGTSATECTSCNAGMILQSTKCVIPCAFGLYLDGVTCTPCHSSCLSCTNGTSNDCTSCLIYASLTAGGCVNNTCHESLGLNCIGCSSAAVTACVLPASGYYLGYFNQPVAYAALCDAGKYYSASNKSCQPCAQECSHCSGPTNIDCVYCATGNVRQDQLCSTNPNNCSIHGGQAIVPLNLTCTACTVAHCLECTTPGFCTHCETGYYSKIDGTCNPCSNNTIYCQDLTGLSLACDAGYFFQGSANCTKCAPGEYQNGNGQCTACDASCLACSYTGSYCSDCYPGDGRPYQYYSSRRCNLYRIISHQGYYNVPSTVMRCSRPCLTCLDATSCLECHEGYYLNGTSCLPCDSICHSCNTSSSNCTRCHMGYQLSASTSTCTQICEKYEYFNTTTSQCLLCPRPCSTCDLNDPSVCLQCQNDHYLDAGICKPCHESCAKCTGPAENECTYCLENYKLSGSTCNRNWTSTSNTYLHPGTDAVYLCHKFCMTCTGPSPYNCTSCLTGFTLKLSTNPPDFGSTPAGFCNRDCANTHTLVYPYPNECFYCHPACATCFGQTQDACLTCNTGYYLSNRICLPCSPFCQTCSGPSSYDCLTCQASWTLDNITAPTGFCLSSTTCAATSSYLNYSSNQCESCHSDCMTCTAPHNNSCLTCYLSKPIMLSNYCVIECPSQQYYNITLVRCEPCHSTCKSCTSPLETDCTECLAPGHLIQATPTTCAANCSVAGYIDAGNATNCQACLTDNCRLCVDGGSTSCTRCFGGYLLQLDKLCGYSCPADQFLDVPTGSCKECHSNCASCKEETAYDCLTCESGKTLSPDGSCKIDCGIGNYYMPDTDTCGMCDATCEECTAGSHLDCTKCKTGLLMQPDNSCQSTCQPRTFLDVVNHTCYLCSANCESCQGAIETDCLTCLPNLFKTSNGACTEVCPKMTYENSLDSTCSLCHASCNTCTGSNITQCIDCINAETSVLTAESMCVDCSQIGASETQCLFTAELSLKVAGPRLTEKTASASLQITFKNYKTYLTRLQTIKLESIFGFEIQAFSRDKYKIVIEIRQGEIVADLFASSTSENEVEVKLFPLKKAAIVNTYTEVTELILVEKNSSVSIFIKNSPNGATMSAFKNIDSVSAASSSTIGAIIVASTGLVTTFPAISGPLIKLFTIFKIVSRLRLINVNFGIYLESFLTACNAIFKIGGDDITKAELRSAPATRGKLEVYRVSVVASQPIGWKFGVFILAIMVRVYRSKIRKYAVKIYQLDVQDRWANRLAESLRIVMFTVVGIDIFFYSLHCVAHVYYQKDIEYSVDINMSLILSYIGLLIIVWDLLILGDTNQTCTFTYLRRKYRIERMVLNKDKVKRSELPASNINVSQSKGMISESASNTR